MTEKNMMNMNFGQITAFGKVTFVPKNNTVPPLPDMNLLVFEKEKVYQAVCIDIEIDAVGNSLEESCDNLKTALRAYTSLMIENYERDINAAVKDIINVVYSTGETKTLLLGKYLQAKQQYLLNRVTKENRVKSKGEIFIKALQNLFQFEPIRFSLTPLAGSV